MVFSVVPMCNLRLGFEAGKAGFDFRDLSPGSSASSLNGASCTSSYDSPTPTSGRSTPAFSTGLDFSSSFASSVDAVVFDLSPPSSATSTYFPMSPKNGNAFDFVYTELSLTPTPAQLSFSSHQFCPPPMASSHEMDCSFFMNPLSQTLMSTPSSVTPFERLPAPVSHWTHSDSPVSFQQHSPSRVISPTRSIKQECEENMMAWEQSSAARRRARLESSRLQKVQKRHQQQPPHIKSEKQHLPPLVADDVVEPGKYRCREEGCTSGPYRRNEHLKRHMKTKHDKDEILYACNWCLRKVNRKDNFISHLKLHTVPGRKARIKFEPGAVLQYQEEIKKFKPRRR
ncbi:hypothetical protein VTI74DRAFT_6856 [Chaetomium olivicolor]